VLFGDADVDRPALGVLDEVRIARVVGIAQHHLVAGIEKVAEQEQHRRRGTGCDEDLVGRDRHPVGPRVVLHDRLPERQDPEAVRVARPPVLDRARQGVAHRRGRLEVGLAELEVDHVDAGALELLRPLRDLDGQERLDLLDPPRERHAPPRPTRPRAAMICHTMPGPRRSPPTLLPAWSAQFAGAWTMRQPTARACKSNSTSKPKPRVASASNSRVAAGAVNALKPHWESAIPRRPNRATNQLKRRPAATRCERVVTDPPGSTSPREPIATSAPAISSGSSRLSSSIGVAPSASAKRR